MRKTDTQDRVVVFDDYPTGKFARKCDWWLSEAGLEVIAGWRQCGATIADIVDKMGIDPRTFRAWRNKCPELEDILTVGKEVTNARVVGALYKRATGFYYDETTQELIEGEMRVTKVVTKYVPPDVKAALSWLFSRWPDAWRAIQPPLDTDTPSVLAAEDILVKIKGMAEEATGSPLLGIEDGDVLQPSGESEAQGNATGSQGDTP